MSQSLGPHSLTDPAGVPAALASVEVSFVKLSHTSRRIGAVLGTIAVAMTMTVSGTAAAGGGSKPKPAKPEPIAIRVLSVNDFHGNLQPPTGSSGRITLSDGKTTVNAGGAA